MRIGTGAAMWLGAAGLMVLATGAAAEKAQEPDYPSVVPSFEQICLMPGFDPADRLAAIGAASGWREDESVTVDIPKMSISRTISQNYSFANVAEARQWTGMIDGQPARIVLARFAGKPRYPNLCALVLEGPSNAMPFGSALRAAFKTFGIGGKSVDLVHYFEYAGKVGADKHPVRGEIFSRSLSGQIKETTHIYVAY